MLLADAPLTLREFVTHEELPLASVFREMFLFLRGRQDVVLFGAHAVNAYCDPDRMTEDVDLLSTRAPALAEEIRAHLADRFHIAVRVREVADGVGFRIYQVRKPKNRHLVDVRLVSVMPPHRSVDLVAVLDPIDLAAMKTVSASERRSAPKGGTDIADLRRILLAFPELKVEDGAVAAHLRSTNASDRTLDFWREVVRAPIDAEADESIGDETE